MSDQKLVAVLVLSLGAQLQFGCSSSSAAKVDAGTAPHPAPPALGAQISRVGRPGVALATYRTFDPDATARTQALAGWQQNGDSSSWVAKYAGDIGKSLAVLDSLDTTCGNQLFADGTKNDNAGRYGTLASVLADDRLWLYAAGDVCSIYLAVEADATKLVPNHDCGGRHPSYDVFELTYSLLAVGTYPATPELTRKVGVTDGTVAVPAKTDIATFPFLANPK